MRALLSLVGVALALLVLLALLSRDSNDDVPATRPIASVAAEEHDPVAAPRQPTTLAPARDAILPRTHDGSERAEATIPDDGRIHLIGRVFDVEAGGDAASGIPAAGVSIRVEGLGKSRDAPRTKSRVDGSFELAFDEPARRPSSMLLVTVEEVDGRLSGQLRLTLADDERSRAGLELLRPRCGDLSGVTVDLDGHPIEGVEVSIPREDVTPVVAVSDANGMFLLPTASGGRKIATHKAGFLLVDGPTPTPNRDGTWDPMRLVLTESGALRVAVRAGADRPVADVQVRVALSTTEAEVSHRSWGRTSRPFLEARTDASGIADVPNVWAGMRLAVELYGDGVHHSFERVVQNRAVLRAGVVVADTAGEKGEPLVLTPGRRREVSVVLVRIRGFVFDSDGSPVDKAGVLLETLRRGVPEHERDLSSTVTDADGAYELTAPGASPFERVRVRAANWKGRERPGHGPARRAYAELELDPLSQDDVRVDLTLAPTLALAGRVIDPEGTGIATLVTVVATDGGSSATPMVCISEEDGAFRLSGLDAGRYRVEASYKGYAAVRLDTDAGDEEIVIRLVRPRPARVSVEVTSLVELDAANVYARPVALREIPPTLPELPFDSTYDAPFGWPPELSLSFGQYFYKLKGGTRTLELDEGAYWIGANARTKDGTYCFPIGTGLVQVAAGEYRLRFELTPGARVAGRVVGTPTGTIARGELLAAVAAVETGRLIPLDVRLSSMQPMTELGADGSFAFELVPVGTWELRVGTRAQLLDGAFTHREPLTVPRAGIEDLEVRVDAAGSR